MKKALCVVAISFIFVSCKDNCKTCYLVAKDTNGTVVRETDVGEYCGDEWKTKEDTQLTCIAGPCYFDCR